MNVFVGCSSRATNNEDYNRIAEEIVLNEIIYV